MSQRSVEKGLNASNMTNGLLLMILAITIFFFSGAAILALILLFSMILMLSGVARIFNAFSNDELTGTGAIIKFISGVLLIIIAIFITITVLLDPLFSVAFIIVIYSIALIIVGIARILTGLVGAKYMKWFRILLFIIGIVVVILSLIVLFAPTLSNSMVFSMFAISIFLSGFARFLLGFTGKEKYTK